MTRYETMQVFQDALKAEETNSRDSVVSAKEFQYGAHRYTKWADTQVANKVGIPVKYYQKMKEEEPELLVQNVNTWLKKDNRKFLVRELNKEDGSSTVRAFLSDRYLPLSNRLVCNTIAVTMYEMKVPFEVLRSWITDCSMYLTIVSPMKHDLGGGDTVQLGIQVRNSEVGYSRFQVDTFMFRHYCKNGMIFGKNSIGSFSKVHRGQSMNVSGYIDLSDTTKRLDVAHTLSAMRDIVKGTFDESKFGGILEAVKNGKNIVVNDKVGAIGMLKEQQKLSDELEKLILSQFTESTQYGMANAVTAVARERKNEEDQIGLEELGGEIMLLSPDRFRKKYVDIEFVREK